MTDQEKQELRNEIVAYLIENSQQISDIEISDSLDGISSMPAIKSGTPEDIMVRVPLGLLVPELRHDESSGYIQYRKPEGDWIDLYIPESGPNTFTYKSDYPIIKDVGSIKKGSNFENGINFKDLLNKAFFPNIEINFPNKPIYIGVSNEKPTTSDILRFQSVDHFKDFYFNSYVDIGYIVIATPANTYLNKIENDCGMNIISTFYSSYKSIPYGDDYDIYNVYISPFLKYHDVVDLTFYVKFGDPVSATLEDAIISQDDVIPNILMLNIKEGEKSIINKMTIKIRDIIPNLNSIALNQADVNPQINSLSIVNRDIIPVVNYVNIDQGFKSVLNNIYISNGNSILNSINIKNGKSILNKITIQEGSSIILDISIKDGRSLLNNIVLKDGRAILNKIIINK